ncbi:MAG: autotransporter assembly complex family protein [Paracoccaceae bacterium]|nr:autotransporter assembly complex family protein [Paracoccaceae bacterium]
MVIAAGIAMSGTAPAQALEDMRFFASGLNDGARERLGNASLLALARSEGVTDPVELLATARAEYARLIEALYAEGYYGPEISVRVDGREAATIPPFERPSRIDVIVVDVRAGQRFRFGKANVRPVTTTTVLPDDFRRGRVARTGTLIETAQAAVDGWRDAGHPKARVAGEDLRVRHRDGEMDAAIFIEPGPRLRFGTLAVAGNERVRTSAVRRIIGWPRGEVVTPDERDRAANRLRRSGAFRSVVLTEAEVPNPDGTLDFGVALVEERPRRFGIGGEISTEEGLRLTAFWLHRNLLGDAERLRFDAEIAGIGGQTGGIDTLLSTRFERPATFFVDTDLFVGLSYENLDEPDFASETIEAEVGLERIVSDALTLEVGVAFRNSTVTDATGSGTFQLLSFPGRAVWNTRDDPLDPTEGYFIDAGLTPFLGFSDAGTGVRATADARIYRRLGADGRFVVAARGQLGSVIGPDISSVPADLRFFSGGGGTVRGQPYQSLGVDLDGELTGGLSFAALSGELRAALGDTIGLVGFVDVGFVGENALPGIEGDTHAGAGLGLRYNAGLGPIRFDVAVPVSESSGGSLFFYVGIGQAF